MHNLLEQELGGINSHTNYIYKHFHCFGLSLLQVISTKMTDVHVTTFFKHSINGLSSLIFSLRRIDVSVSSEAQSIWRNVTLLWNVLPINTAHFDSCQVIIVPTKPVDSDQIKVNIIDILKKT